MICALVAGYSSCAKNLEVHNPNYITDDQMKEFMQSDPSTQEQVLTGLTGSLQNNFRVYNAAINGGYSNSGGYEFYKDFMMVMQSGDIVEGTQANPGTFSVWYQNKADNMYWSTDQDVNNYGYYLAAVYKISDAQKALDFLTKESCETGTEAMKAARAKALVSKAYGYLRLMERYTDLKDPNSENQGMPWYDKYAYNTPVAPSTIKETWGYIKDMLNEAVTLFHSTANNGYTTGNTQTADAYDIDCGVAQYIRAMAALDMKDYATVIEAYNDVISRYPELIKAEDYGMPASKVDAVNQTVAIAGNKRKYVGEAYNAENNAFFNVSKNPEAIFSTLGGTNQCWNLRALNNLKNGESGFKQVDQKIYEALSDDDVRKSIITNAEVETFWTYSVEKDTVWSSYKMPKYTSMKFAATEGRDKGEYGDHTNAVTKSDEAVFRTSALLLMAAEAYAMSNNGESSAKDLLNKLLAARTLPGHTTMTVENTMNGGNLLDFIKLQWRIEMWGEGDFAFFNQKRWGVQFDRGGNHWSTKGVESQGWTWEIPRKERQGNPNWK